MSRHRERANSPINLIAGQDRPPATTDHEDPTLPPSKIGANDPTFPTNPGNEEAATMPPRGATDDTAMPQSRLSSPEGASVGDRVRYFGDYALLEEIARGGMGVVFKARQVNLNRTVALKMILAGQFAGEEDVQRFYTEAEAAAQLDHPGIVPIFEIGEHQGQHYFSMGYIDGQSLAQKVADGPLPPREAAELVINICDAMAYSHERGVIHRDLKPANVLMDPNGQPKVTDFGLARKTETDSNLTGTGQILGTPAYMPPEQASGKMDVGPLADVYSIGAILYCLLTGRPPFQAASPMDTLLQVLEREPVAPHLLNPEVPRDLETVCLKCLRKAPPQRYASASALASDLKRFLDGEPILARTVSTVQRTGMWCKRNPRSVATVFSVVSLLLIVAVVISLVQQHHNDRRLQTIVASINSQNGIMYPPLSDLDDFPSASVLNEMQSQFKKSEGRQKLSLAIALAQFGDVRASFLVTQLDQAMPGDAAGIVASLNQSSQEALSAIAAQSSKCDEQAKANSYSNGYSQDAIAAWNFKARLAMLGMQLGDNSIAEDMCKSRSDPIQRTIFVDESPAWCADLGKLREVSLSIGASDLRTSICSILDRVSPKLVTSEEKDAWRSLLTDWFLNQPDAGTHSASGLALRRWNFPLPDLPLGIPEQSERQWNVNDLGITMLQVPAGAFRNKLGRKVEVEEFLLSDREISAGFFQQFVDDSDHPSNEKPKNWNESNGVYSPTKNHPAPRVSWFDAVMFCNWLSKMHGFSPCYERTGTRLRVHGSGEEVDDWQLVLDRNGYRLPTEAEWEFACRAGTSTIYSFGNDSRWIDAYGVCQAKRAEPCGSRLPNQWGFFDMHGNVIEWCNDFSGPEKYRYRAQRGGSWRDTAGHCGTAYSLAGDSPWNRFRYERGFRVAVAPAE